MILRLPLVAVVTLVACRDHKAAGVRRSPLETAIARDLTAKLATPVTATCEVIAVVAKCDAVLADGTKLPVEAKSEGSEWAWRVAGLVIETLPIATHINAVLADMKLAQQADCGPRIVFVAPGDRIGCKLSGGGMAFVQFAADGTTSLELDIDATSGAARGELVTPERDRELTEISRALEHLEGESDGEEEVLGDGGVLGDAGVPSDGDIAKP